MCTAKMPLCSVVFGLVFACAVTLSGGSVPLDFFDHDDGYALDGHNTQRIPGITPAKCATFCLQGTTTVSIRTCLSFDYDNNGAGTCILSTASKDTNPSDFIQGNPITRFDYYHKKDILQFFDFYNNKALSGHNDQDINSVSDPGVCALHCIQGYGSVPAGSCRSFDIDNTNNKCILSLDSADSLGVPLTDSSTGRFDYYQRKEIDFCAATPCVHGTCTSGLDGYNCTCDTGWEGTDCDTDTTPCDPNPCVNGGSCTDGGPGIYSCTCTAGWTGDNCEQDVNECAPNPCTNGGSCTQGPEGSGTYICACTTGWTGGNCEQDINECAPNPCTNGGSCTQGSEGSGTYICTCTAGWTGDNCQQDLDGCSPNPCHTQATCTDNPAPALDAACVCKPGYTGDGLANGETGCRDIDACLSNPCHAQAECTDNPAPALDAACVCNTGYTGDGLASGGSGCTDLDGCSPNPCHAQATCTDNPAPALDATCICNTGYTGDGLATGGTGCTGCGHCATNTVCHPVTGVCPAECEPPWTGNTCRQIRAEIRQSPMSVRTSINQPSAFTCAGRGEPMPSVTWRHNGDMVTAGIVTAPDQTQHTFTSTLSFSRVQRTDNGQYTCTAANVVNTDTSQPATLTVLERPEDITVTVTSHTSTEIHATVTVGFTGNLPITTIQVRNKQTGEAESSWGSWTSVNFTGTQGTFGITGLAPGTEYTGEVQAQNDEGWSQAVQFTWRTRDAPPGPPSGLRASSSSHEIDLMWQKPAVTNGVITNYYIQYGPTTGCSDAQLAHEWNTTDSTTSITFSGLIPYTTYSFRVRAYTSAGPGDFTGCVTEKTAEHTPTEPTSVELADVNPCNCETANQPRTIELQARWRRPEHVYGELRGYNMKLQQQDRIIFERNLTQGLENEELVYVVTENDVQQGLKPAQEYYLKVSAYNDVYGGKVNSSSESQTSDGCPTGPLIFKTTQEGMCAVNWTEPSHEMGDITGYSVIVTATRLDDGLVSVFEPEPILTSQEQDQEWKTPIDELPAYSVIHVTVRAKTCAEGDNSEEVECRVERKEPPQSVPSMDLTDSNPTSTSFEVSLPQVSQRNGPISCYQVIVVKMNTGETLAELTGRLGEPNDILTSHATDEGKIVPYVAKAFSGDNVESDAITIGGGDDCTDPCCHVGVVEEASEPGNKELTPGSTYTTVIRAHVDTSQGRKRATSQAFTSSEYGTPVTTGDSTPVGAIVGAILAVVAVLCIVGGGVFFYRRRLAGKDDSPLRIPRRSPTKRTVKEDETQLGAIGGIDEEAAEVKKSPAPKQKSKPRRPSRRGGASPSLDLRQPIPIHRLEREFARRHANDDQLFVEEYSSLPKPFGREHAEAYYNEENASRNKFRNIIAYDRGLVRLTPIEGVPGSGYIHASFMDGYQEQSKFIAAQGPMDNTVDDFWRMIWETGSTAIVMVTNLEEKGKKKCSQYWPNNGEKTYAIDLVVRLEDTVTMVDHVIRTLLLKKAGERRVRKVTHFHFIGWPDFGLPKSPMGLLKFHKTVMSALNPRDRPIVVHCSAGVGRTGTFITVDAMLDMIRAEGKVDVFGFVQQMRQNRSFMVQTEGQYVFIFKAILEYYLYGDTETEVSNIHRYMQRLRVEDPQTGKTGIETEFGKLTRIPVDKANMRSGNLPENLSKNRVLQVLPYDTTRVFLQQKPGVKGADYINASFIDGYNMKDAYIATQGPLDRTVEDFWRMVWEWNSCSIVMLTELKEKSQNKCAVYWPEEGNQTFGDFIVSLSDQTDYPDYTLRTLNLTKSKQAGPSRTVQQFHFHGWPEVGVPDNASGMIDLIGQVQKQQQQSGNGPITVHCSAGAGRTGAFCAISTVLERVKAEGVCDVFQVVKTLRMQRPHMVQTLDQYQFCYQAVVEYLDSFDHYANFR